MTLEEYIVDCEQVMFGAEVMRQTEVYTHNRQLVGWLEELTEYRKAWSQLKEIVTELRDNGGKKTQKDVCSFLASYINVLEGHINKVNPYGE